MAHILAIRSLASRVRAPVKANKFVMLKVDKRALFMRKKITKSNKKNYNITKNVSP